MPTKKMIKTSVDIINDEKFSQLSLLVSQFPKTLTYWEQLLNHLMIAAGSLNKNIDKTVYNLIKSVYESMLIQFPFLENYYIDYALFEYKIGHINKMHAIFERGLSFMNNRSLLLWIQYLKICNQVIMNDIHLFKKYAVAESYIGLHFFSGEFWELYLKEIEVRCKQPQRYLLVLRKVLEIPTYHYSGFYDTWLRKIDNISDLKQVKFFAPDEELWKKLKVDIHLGGRRGPHLQEAKKQLRKFTKELYIVVQFQVSEIYNLFESKFSTNYYTSPETLIEHKEIITWSKYLDFTITNRINDLIKLNFQRALVVLCHYDIIWLKFANWLINYDNDYISAKNILKQGLTMSHKKSSILSQLSSVMIRLGDYSELNWIYDSIENSYQKDIAATDNMQLFLDYLEYKIFLTMPLSQSRYTSNQEIMLLTDQIMELILKRLSFQEEKQGYELLLSVLRQMYGRIARKVLEEKIFKHLIKNSWTYYLNDGRFWYEYCQLIWFDSSRSYLERRREIAKNIWEMASKYQNTKDSLKIFAFSYLPEDLELLELIFKKNQNKD